MDRFNIQRKQFSSVIIKMSMQKMTFLLVSLSLILVQSMPVEPGLKPYSLTETNLHNKNNNHHVHAFNLKQFKSKMTEIFATDDQTFLSNDKLSEPFYLEKNSGGIHKETRSSNHIPSAPHTYGGSLSNLPTSSGSEPLSNNHHEVELWKNSKNVINNSPTVIPGVDANIHVFSSAETAEKFQFRQKGAASRDSVFDSGSSVVDSSQSSTLIEAIGEEKEVKPPSLQLAVKSSYNSDLRSEVKVSTMWVTLGASLIVMFSLGIVVGVFCCCKKKSQADENENAEKLEEKALMEKSVHESTPLEDVKKPEEVVNSSDIPSGEKDLDDPISVKDKIKAFDSKLIIGPSPDHVAKRHSQLHPSPKPANRTSQIEPVVLTTPDKRWSQLDQSPGSKRKSQHEMNLMENKVFSNQVNKNKAEEEKKEEEDVVKSKESKSKSLGDNISKSDTQDDISDKIFDNLSTHSGLSVPHNPDVIIASDDDDDEFAALQRGTVILKSFQRAKPPRNRSPATRTSKGKIRKSRPNLTDDTSMSKSLTLSTSQDLSVGVRGQISTPSTTSLPLATGPHEESPDKQAAGPSVEKITEDLRHGKNGAVGRRVGGSPQVIRKPKDECLMTKSLDFGDFDSVMNNSVTSVSSDVGMMPRKFKKNNDSPNQDRNESPARSGKADKRAESPSRYRKTTDSPVGRRKHRRRERDRERVSESSNGRTAETPTTPAAAEDNAEVEVNEPAVKNRLSGLPANAANNIFYLIDPTVKNKCKSVGDVAANKRRSGDYSKENKKASKHKANDDPDSEGKDEQQEDGESPVKRERTRSDPSRQASMDDPKPS